jgi:putative membrane protein
MRYNMVMLSHFTRQHIILLITTLAYVGAAGWYFMGAGNYEFVWYIAVMLLFVVLIGATLRTSQLPLWLLWLLAIWGLLHMLGGGVQAGDGVLYGYVVLPLHLDGEFTLLKYDQLVHAYGFGVAALAVRYLLKRSIGNAIPGFWLGAVAVCAAMGLGALNEIVEFAAVVASPSTGVGGYYNTVLDLVFNGLGALIAVIGAAIVGKSLKNQ